ncbi:MAG: hypothetical protein HRT46_09380 [Deltaproteobacteria bacterium]|nr:hypothetical protein [Deltaproteobacteria bacterium]
MRRFIILALLLSLFLGGVAVFPTPAPAQPWTLELALPAGGQQHAAAERRAWFAWLTDHRMHAGRCGYDADTGSAVVEVPDSSALAELVEAGFVVLRSFDDAPLEPGRTQSQYYDPSEIQALLTQAAANYPSITRLFVVGTSWEGRDIYGLEISDNPGTDEDEPSLLFNSQHHSREVATPHVAMDVVDTLTAGYGVDATITAWVNDYKTVVVPVVNPDGTQHVFDVDSLWRKNRQTYGGSCTGVDLNRNYSYLWGPAGCGSGVSCSQETYRGPSASSELESSAMAALSDQWHFTTAISWHAYGQFIDYPYACSNGAANEIMPEHDVIHEMMHGMADAIDAVDSTPRFDVYSPASGGPISGDDTSWYYAYHGTYAMLVEVGLSFEPNFADVPAIVSRNRAGWQYLYSRLGGARLDVHTTDSATGLPMEATVTLTDYVFDTGELARNTFLPFGRWTYMLPANATYTVQASAAGYVTQQQAVAVGAVPAELSIALVADNCGNGAIDSGEQCDGVNLAGQDCVSLGYLAGTLACGGDCLFDTSACSNSICGNGLIEGSEQCDGANLGGQDCAGLGYVAGTLACDGGCSFDTSSCAGPVCGNDTVEGSEQCDGSDDAACPGLCIAAGEVGECSCEADSTCTNSDGSRDLAGRPRFKLSGLGDGVPGNERMLLKGELTLPVGALFADINLGSTGLLLSLAATDGSSLAEVALPSGSYLGTGTRGWRVNGAGTKWKYADKTGSAVGGINKVMLVDRSKKTPGAAKLIVKARDGAYPLEQGDEPPLLTVVLGDASAAAAGLCTESAFVLADCRYNGSATKLSCKQ